LVGQFISGALPILWVGIASIFVGTFLSNWLGGISKQISDSLRLIVLAALYPTLAQFTNILINDESSFTLIPPLLVGMAVTLISAVILFKKFKKRADEELLSD
jgi:putative membrane protein